MNDSQKSFLARATAEDFFSSHEALMALAGVLAAILLLFAASRPAYIPGLIVAVIVLSVYGMVWRRSGANFSEEFIEVGESKLYSPPAVIRIAFISRIGASLLGIYKCAEFRTLLSAYQQSMPIVLLPQHFTLQAAATPSVTAAQCM